MNHTVDRRATIVLYTAGVLLLAVGVFAGLPGAAATVTGATGAALILIYPVLVLRRSRVGPASGTHAAGDGSGGLDEITHHHHSDGQGGHSDGVHSGGFGGFHGGGGGHGGH